MSEGVRGGPQKRGYGKANPKFTSMLYQEGVVGRKGTSVHNVDTVQSICTWATCNQSKSGVLLYSLPVLGVHLSSAVTLDM